MPPYMSSPLTVGPRSPVVEQLSASGNMATRNARQPVEPTSRARERYHLGLRVSGVRGDPWGLQHTVVR